MIRIKGVIMREGTRDDWEPALALAWKVFNEFDAVDYTPEGKENFRRFLGDGSLDRMFRVGSYRLFTALLYGNVIGMLTLREGTHISLLFVDGNCHRNGVGSELVRLAARTIGREKIGGQLTVNASPYAIPFYERLGFTATGSETEQDGIRFTPMKLRLSVTEEYGKIF